MTDQTRPVCLVTGVGPGTGAAVVRRFAAGGYNVAMLARKEERLNSLAAEIEHTTPYVCDVTDFEALEQTIEAVQTDLGTPVSVVHNAVGGGWGNFLDIEPEMLERNFQVNVMALLHLSRSVAPAMIEAGEGSIMITGNTSARRGKAGFAGFAPTKAAQRILAESMARDLGPKGVHVGFIMIDAVIDLAWTRKRWPDHPDDFFCKPDDIASVVWDTAHQNKSAWAFEIEIRPFGETW